MNKFYTHLVLSLLAVLPTPLLANQTIADGWSRLLLEHSGLAAQAKKVDAMAYQLSESKALHLPEISLAGHWNMLDDEVGMWFDTSALMPGGQPIYLPLQEQQYADAQLTMTLPLYTGGKIKAAKLASKANLLEQQAMQQQFTDQLFVSYIERYLSVSLAQKNVDIRRVAAANLQQHYDRAVRMQEEGTIAYTQRLTAQVERDKAERELNQALVDLQLAMSAYQALFQSEVAVPNANLLFVDSDSLNVETTKVQGLTYAPALKQISAKQALAQAGLLATKSQWLPSVAAFAQVELIPDDLTQLDPNWAAGVALEWRIFGKGNRFAQASRYSALEQAASYSATQAQRDLSVLIEKTLFEIDSAKNAYQALLSSKALADENLRLQEKAFAQGVNTSLDIIDADVLVTGIYLQSQKTLFDYYLAQAKLSSLLGDHDTYLQQLQLAQQPAN